MDKPWNNKKVCNVAGALAWQASRQPDVTAIHYPSSSWLKGSKYRSVTYRQLEDLSNAYATGMAEFGIVPGTRTALMLKPGLDFFAVFFALFKTGAVPVLIDPGIGLDNLKQCLAEAEPKAFIGTTKAQIARKWFGWAKGSCELVVTAGFKPGPGGISLKQLRQKGGDSPEPVLHPAQANDIAAILFTSGSTGVPKGVIYRARHFIAQVDMLQAAFDIQPGEVSLPTFPPFALFDPALGMTTVVPEMDPTQPAKADPEKLIAAIEKYQVTNLFSSPALLDTLSRYTQQQQHGRLWSIKRVISAGAAVSPDIVRRMETALANDAKIHTPYGATECLPVTTISNMELDSNIQDMTESGSGVCIGYPVEPNEVRVIAISDNVIDKLSDSTEMPPGMPGEIVVFGPSCTDAYWGRKADTQLAKIPDELGNIWHRMGDIGIKDGKGCLWFCGRSAQRVETGSETLFPDQVEAVFNQHPDARRTALVGVGAPGRQIPVLCVEVRGPLAPVDSERVHFDMLQLGQAHALTREVRTVLFHPGFPVDTRHNSKIRREELAQWALKKMQEAE